MIDKKCSRCNLIKPINCFGKSNKEKSGYRSECKECRQKFKLTHRKKYPEKIYSRNIGNKIKKEKGIENHHWSYLIEHAKDVIQLPLPIHRKVHRYTIYDQERCMYRTLHGYLLDSKKLAINYYNSLKDVE
jgi:hypothetical protein